MLVARGVACVAGRRAREGIGRPAVGLGDWEERRKEPTLTLTRHASRSLASRSRFPLSLPFDAGHAGYKGRDSFHDFDEIKNIQLESEILGKSPSTE